MPLQISLMRFNDSFKTIKTIELIACAAEVLLMQFREKLVVLFFFSLEILPYSTTNKKTIFANYN